MTGQSRQNAQPSFFDFGDALALLWQGRRVRRSGWIDDKTYDRWLELRTDLKLTDGMPAGFPQICYANETDASSHWVPSQTDVLAGDWMEVTEP